MGLAVAMALAPAKTKGTRVFDFIVGRSESGRNVWVTWVVEKSCPIVKVEILSDYKWPREIVQAG
jgi:hypothetical protein